MPPYALHHPTQTLFTAFVAWKSFLLLVAIGSSLGPAYDTSSTLIPPHVASSSESTFDLATRLTRWDAIYYVQSSRQGYVFEQEWAFGSGLPYCISLFTKVLKAFGSNHRASLDQWIGVGIAHASHLLSALALYQLGLRLHIAKRQSFTAALLHILSPAGLFLSAPYPESTFACLSFLGYYLFAHGCLGKPRVLIYDVVIVGSGIVFGLATTFRSNGLLNGIPFATLGLLELSRTLRTPSFVNLRRLAALGLGGLFVAIGSVGPQAIAYQNFCSELSATELRPWCTKRIPSIYTFVQEKYWNVGFLRYWTALNIPLFLLAVPVLYLLMASGFEVLTKTPIKILKQRDQSHDPSATLLLLQSMAASQLVLATLAITTYHIQIITRISSGYPLWYLWLAGKLESPDTSKAAGRIVMFMVIYASIQGALFASFLPPA